MAAIGARILNQGLGQFHGGGAYRNANYHNRYQDEPGRFETFSDSDSDDSSVHSKLDKFASQNYDANKLSLEKHRALMRRKDTYITTLENYLKYLDTTIFVLGITGTILANIESELYYRNNSSEVEYSSLYRALVSVSTAILVVLIIIHAKFDYNISKEKREVVEEEVPEFFRSKNFAILLIELGLNIIHCPPGINHVFKLNQLGGTLSISLSEICASIMLLRAYMILKIFRHHTKWTSENARRVCRMNETEATASFAIKALMKDRPFYVLVPMFLLSVCILSSALRVFERNFAIGNSSQDYSYIWNAMWLILLTMTTVGYGDFFPRTHFGRFIAVLSCIWGIFLISLMVVTLANFIIFGSEESRSFNYIKRIKSLDNSRKFAKLFIKSNLERFLYYKKAKKDPKYKKNIENLGLNIKFYLKKFKEYRDEARFGDVDAAELLTMLNERISLQIGVIQKNLAIANKLHENLSIAVSAQNRCKESLDSSIKKIDILKKLAFQ